MCYFNAVKNSLKAADWIRAVLLPAARLAGGAVHHGDGDPGGWGAAAVSVL